MTQSELILEYIDGSLEPSGEQVLFDTMARNPEIRGMLRQYITISDAVRLDREAYTPPAAVEGALMRGLGIIPPETSSRVFPFAGLVGGKFLALAGAFVLGVLLAGSSVYYLMNQSSDSARVPMVAAVPVPVVQEKTSSVDGSPSTGSVATAATNSTATTSTTTASTATVPSTASAPLARSSGNTSLVYSSSGSSSRGVASGRTVLSNSASRSSALRNTASQSATSRNTTSPEFLSRNSSPLLTSLADSVDSRNNSSTSGNDRTNASATVIPTEPIAVALAPQLRGDNEVVPRIAERIGGDLSPLDVTLPEKEREKGGFLELRRGIGGDLSSSHALGVARSPFEDIAIGGYLRNGSSFAFGLEGGYERYAQTLHYQGEDTILVEQRPAYLWGGGSVRYYPGTIGGTTLRPLFQGTVGLASAGPLFRGRIGLGAELFSGLRASVGFEMSSLLYTFNGAGYLSGRWGVVGGIETNLW